MCRNISSADYKKHINYLQLQYVYPSLVHKIHYYAHAFSITL